MEHVEVMLLNSGVFRWRRCVGSCRRDIAAVNGFVEIRKTTRK